MFQFIISLSGVKHWPISSLNFTYWSTVCMACSVFKTSLWIMERYGPCFSKLTVVMAEVYSLQYDLVWSRLYSMYIYLVLSENLIHGLHCMQHQLSSLLNIFMYMLGIISRTHPPLLIVNIWVNGCSYSWPLVVTKFQNLSTGILQSPSTVIGNQQLSLWQNASTAICKQRMNHWKIPAPPRITSGIVHVGTHLRSQIIIIRDC